MKDIKKITAAAFMLSVMALSGCGVEEDTAVQADVTTAEAEVQETVSEAESIAEETEAETEAVTEAITEEKTETESQTELEEVSESTETEAYFEDSFAVHCYEVTADGSYSFTHSGNDDVPWNIYILDEKFTDGTRYLYSNYVPDGETEFTADLKAGQYVYCICTVNEWNSDAEADSQLTIEFVE